MASAPKDGAAASAAVTDMSLAEARVHAKDVETRIARSVPGFDEATASFKDSGSLLGCAGGGDSWASSARVPVETVPDTTELMRSVETGLADVGEYAVTLESTAAGGPRVVVEGPRGETYFVEPLSHVVDVASFSACFAYDPKRDGYAWEL
jgi:hypothetical protein